MTGLQLRQRRNILAGRQAISPVPSENITGDQASDFEVMQEGVHDVFCCYGDLG